MANPEGPITLSDHHGRNLELNKDRTKATWALKTKGGYSFITSPLEVGDSYFLQVQGSGHAQIGFTMGRPGTSDFDYRADLATHTFLLRQKKTTTKLEVSREENKVTVTELNNKINSQEWTVAREVIVVTVDILFGDISFEIDQDNSTKGLLFDDRYSNNIKLTENKQRICLRRTNQKERCSTKRWLLQREIIILQLNPLPDANWVSAKVYLSNYSPSALKQTSRKILKLVPIKRVKRAGDLHLCVKGDEVIVTFLMKEDRMRLNELDVLQPLYLYVELFRMTMKIRSVIPRSEPLPPYLKVNPMNYQDTPPPFDSFDQVSNINRHQPVCEPDQRVLQDDSNHLDDVSQGAPTSQDYDTQRALISQDYEAMRIETEMNSRVTIHTSPDILVSENNTPDPDITEPKLILDSEPSNQNDIISCRL